MNPNYLALTFQMGDFDHEIWLALLSEWSFESFHDEDDKITGYIQDHDITASLMEFISEHAGTHFVDFELAKVPDKNWNAIWESSFNPVAVDDFCFIRAEFHDKIENTFKHIITISPKMAFGTGHHATTFMMVQAMSRVDFANKKVFDFGCGTGILSVVAAKEGASRVVGVDIQPESIENSYEHAQMNEVSSRCEFFLGGLEGSHSSPYDIILANINRNVILEHIDTLSSMLIPGGYLLISGIMFDDVNIIRQALEDLDLQILSKHEKDQWVQITASKV